MSQNVSNGYPQGISRTKSASQTVFFSLEVVCTGYRAALGPKEAKSLGFLGGSRGPGSSGSVQGVFHGDGFNDVGCSEGGFRVEGPLKTVGPIHSKRDEVQGSQSAGGSVHGLATAMERRRAAGELGGVVFFFFVVGNI
ncbi:MAG: hypothetical protein BJ554DRAFT_2433 [Olpidium bornovanus]|uniref:Uncharacterized protein n=1 Tax=Olpidium bornovanus TaxID=278681 RepID=A0A8H7ZQU6_9FUNG|nr:MAG: hypothetical protein BJ554DRAFT_2433 [Olpidium bornovanus]